MKILDYNSRGATIQFAQRELLLVMALLEKGKTVFDCNSKISKRIERQITLVNLLVENKRREAGKVRIFRENIGVFRTVQPALRVLASND
jgi:hypoxanthine-guanine phosphoribosyltransferase